ncbi:MAG TPA: carbonic anhydrase family protein, partial [Burkholderiaceae bacterium]
MRTLAAVLLSTFAVGLAQANDPPPAARASSPASASAAASTVAPLKPVKASAEAIVGALTSSNARNPTAKAPPKVEEPHEMSEEEINAKIAERIANMRAQQAARVAAANRAKKERERLAQKAKNSDHWSYEGESGPAQWGKLNTAWAKCGAGERQSPIDIRDGIRVELEPIAFDYHPSTFSVTDNGHTVQVTLAGGNYITIMNRMYELVQFHFHRPSEERINGRGFEMVAHLVHRDAEGKLAVIAVLIERGKAQALVQTVWNNLPLEKLSSSTPNIVIDMTDLLPRRRDYYTFMGSLTTPPCTEGVLWMVMKEPVQASADQMALFSRLYPMNARP